VFALNRILKKINVRSFVYILAVVYLAVNLISSQFELMTRKQEYDTVASRRRRLEMEVADTQSLLEEGEDDVYIERIARERLGYANPGEIVYIDVQAE